MQHRHLVFGRAALYGTLTAAVAVLMTVVSARFASRDDLVGSGIAVAITALLWWRVWRWVVAVRDARREVP